MRYALVRRGPAKSLPRRWRASRAAMRSEGAAESADRATASAPATDAAACASIPLVRCAGLAPEAAGSASATGLVAAAPRCRSASAGAHSGNAAGRGCHRRSGCSGECGVVRGLRPDGAAAWRRRGAGAGCCRIGAPPLVGRTTHDGHSRSSLPRRWPRGGIATAALGEAAAAQPSSWPPAAAAALLPLAVGSHRPSVGTCLALRAPSQGGQPRHKARRPSCRCPSGSVAAAAFACCGGACEARCVRAPRGERLLRG